MLNNNSWKRKEERELSFTDLVKKITKSWKFILCCAFLFAVLFAGYKYYKDLKSTTTSELEAGEEKALTEEEKESVVYVRSLQNILDEQNAYMKESVLLKINPYQENRTVLHYEINGMDGDDALGLLEQYISYIRNGGAVSDILKLSDLEVPAQHLQEMIRASESVSAYDTFNDRSERFFSVYTIGENAEMADQMADAMEIALKSYGENISTVPEQGLILLSRQSSIVYDMELEQKRNALITNWNAHTNTRNMLISQFSDKQAAEYEGTEGVLENVEKKEQFSTVHLNVKYLIAGIVIGIFLACCWIIFFCFFSNKIRSAVEIERNYDLCVYGAIKKKVKKESENFQHRDQILARMVLNCHKNNLQRLVFVSDNKIDSFFKEDNTFQRELDEHGIKSIIVENMLEQVEVYEQMNSADAVVILAEAERTEYPVFDKMLVFLNENNISLAGVIVIE